MRRHSRNVASSLIVLLVAGVRGACQKTSGEAPAAGGGRGGGVIAVQTTTIQRITIQREVDLAGTLLSPD